MNSIAVKKAATQTAIHPLLLKRWSPLSFSDKMISEEQIEELFEAASWAASAFNEQPWQYIYATRDTAGFEKLWSCLLGGNQPWTKSASLLFVAIQRDNFAKNGKINPTAGHDLGMANAQLLLQAAHRDIYGHLMGGFDKAKTIEVLGLADDVSPVCMGALGYLGDADSLESLGGNYKARELNGRSRKSVNEFTKKI